VQKSRAALAREAGAVLFAEWDAGVEGESPDVEEEGDEGGVKGPVVLADCLRFLVATKSRIVVQRKPRGV
jgi:hypothetical protein